MAVPAGVILIWASTNASIPAGWVRETALDDKFPKGHGAQNPNVSGGSNTHTHTGNHVHTMVDHQHTYATDWSNEWTAGDYSGSSADGGENNMCAKHKHDSATNQTTATTGGGLQSTTVTWSSTNNEPPHHKVIFIKPSGVVAPIKAGIIAHYAGANAPLGFNYCDGNNSTPNLVDKYLKGASAGADAGTTGGSLTHAHTVSHGHTANAHGHNGLTSYNTNPYGARQSQATTGHAMWQHRHTTTLANATDTVANYTNTTAGNTDTVEPAYKKIGAVQCATPSLKIGLIGLWLGSVASIPKYWQACDGSNGTPDMRDKFIKVPANLAGVGATGGSNTHGHGAIPHSHTSNGSHTHTGSTGGTSDSRNRRGANQGQGIVLDYDTHAINTVSSVTPTYNNADLTADTVDNQPAYLTVAYIQLMKIPPQGAGLMAMM